MTNTHDAYNELILLIRTIINSKYVTDNVKLSMIEELIK